MPNGVETNIKRLLNPLLTDIYEGKVKAGQIYPKLLGIVGSVLQDSVVQGTDKSYTSVDFATPDGIMLNRLTRDVWQFSAAKNYQQMRDMTLALVDDNGKLRDFAEFKEQATAVHDKYNGTWLKTEYDHAIGSATMSSRWSEFQQNADDQPYLIYQTVGDQNVRHEHQLLNGIIRKITDDFWRTYFPPNGWKCRCDANQLASSYAVETDALPKVPIDSMFATNLANTGLIFPKGHPYYNGVPTDVMKRAVGSLPDDVAYNNVYVSETTGKTVDMHIYHGINEAGQNIDIAKTLADKGHDVKLLPILGKADDDIRELLYKTKQFAKGKNPDALINNKLFEFTELNATDKALKQKVNEKAVKQKTKQANNVVLKIRGEGLSMGNIDRVLKGQYNNSSNLGEVWIMQNDEIIIKDRSHYYK